MGISWGVGGSQRLKFLKKCMEFNWNFQRGGGSYKKSLLWGRYGHFMELHIVLFLGKEDSALLIPKLLVNIRKFFKGTTAFDNKYC